MTTLAQAHYAVCPGELESLTDMFLIYDNRGNAELVERKDGRLDRLFWNDRGRVVLAEIGKIKVKAVAVPQAATDEAYEKAVAAAKVQRCRLVVLPVMKVS